MTDALVFEGGCYCGALRYKAAGKPRVKGQCHCRECQYTSGGAPNLFMLMPADGFHYTVGQPAFFQRDDLENAVVREFCKTCGTHILTRRSDMTDVVLKIGTLDDPARFRGPKIAIFTIDRQPYHHIDEGIPSFERMP
ncbi:GFA family protein [Parasulfitobacter algicola]|nr:GFA family protein [Sulfitobacter algicola]